MKLKSRLLFVVFRENNFDVIAFDFFAEKKDELIFLASVCRTGVPVNPSDDQIRIRFPVEDRLGDNRSHNVVELSFFAGKKHLDGGRRQVKHFGVSFKDTHG